jgi:exonuclease III
MTHLKDTIMDLFGYSILLVFAMGWIDVLWMFGVENSKEYTWWYLMHYMAN